MFCCHGFFTSCLHLLSIQVWHLRSAHAGSISVYTLSVSWGWLGELPLHTFITWTIFMCAACFFRAADEREPERRTRCVGSACSFISVCFSFDLDMIQVCLLSSFSAFFPVFDMLVSLYFYPISPLLSLISYFYCSVSLLCICLSSSFIPNSSLSLVIISCGCSLLLFNKLHFHHSSFMLQFLMNCSDFQTPTSALHHFFCLKFLVFVLPSSTYWYHFSSSLYISLLSSISFWAAVIICWWGWAIGLGRKKGRLEVVKPVILSSPLSGMCGEWREIWSLHCCNFSLSIWVGRRE